MADSTSVIMDLTTSTGKKTSKSITNVDPNASNGDIKNFADGINSLTSDTINSITKIDKSKLASQYSELTVTITRECDTNNAITINEYDINIDTTKLVDTYDLRETTVLMIRFKLGNIGFIPNYTMIWEGTAIDAGVIMISGVGESDNNKGYDCYLYKETGTGTAKVIVPDGKIGEQNYSGCTFNFTFTA